MAFPATPQRPLPGAYLATPAASRYQQGPPVRQPSFQGQRQAVAPTDPQPRAREAPPPPQAPVQRAARTINEALQKEGNFPDLDSYVKQGISSDYDVPNINTEAAWAPYQRTRMYDIPDRILEQYNMAEVSTLMGLFAELNHAWVTIDNALYMWDYTNPNPEIIGYEEQSNSITAIKLVKPRAGVFVKEVTHVLVVATTAELILLGVASGSETAGVRTISLYLTRMALNIRGINVKVIEGSAASGRIFFSGKGDNDVYELTYQQEEKWFANRCGKVNLTTPGYSALVPKLWANQTTEHVVQMVVDDSRRILYTLSSDSAIRTFYMDSPTTLQMVIEKKRQDFLRDISFAMTAPSTLLDPRMKIISISPVPSREAFKIHLMATTTSGCRLFLSATRSQYTYGSSSDGPPQNMQVHHIKFPPRSEQQPSTQQMQQYGAAETIETGSLSLAYTQRALRFPPGLFFCFVVKENNSSRQHSLFLSGPDTARIAHQFQSQDNSPQQKYFEQACWIPIGSHAEDVGLVTGPFAAANRPLGFGNELAVQYDEPPQEVAILTNTGIHIIRRRRLVDIFAAAIRSQGGEEALEAEVKKFIRNYGRAETTATALAVACGQGNDVTPGDLRIARPSDPETLEQARKCFVEYGGRPSLNENMVSEGPSQAVDNVRPSSRHEGLALYMARLVRSVWKASVINQIIPTANAGAVQIKSTVSLSKLSSIQEDLTKLASFLEKNKSFIEGLAGPEGLQRVQSQQEEVALQGEHQALYSLQKLNCSIIEGISFVQMLFDERVDEIWTSLDDLSKQRLRDLTYETLFSSDQGKDLAKVLVKAIVNRNIANGSNVDTVAEALRRRCGSFCSSDDVIIFKAQEQLKKASEVEASSDMGRKLLNESLKLFQQVSGSLSFQNLQTAAEQFTNLQFYAGAISLALLVAKESDRGNRALAWVNDNKPADDPRSGAYGFRKQCYDLIHVILGAIDSAANGQPESIDGRPTLIAMKRNEARAVIDNSEDELFQFDLYDWYLNQGKVDMLLSVDSPFVVQFLTKSANNNVERADLLWRFHVHRNQFYEAASVQLELAKSEFEIPLAKRIEYLSRAKANASAQSGGVKRQSRQVLLYEVSELLDVANIQDEILHRLRADTRVPSEARAGINTKLNGQILNLSDLYNAYADQASYFDLCLVIYEAADHRNEADINATWQQLLDQTHTKVLEEPHPSQAPYEAIITLIREMSQKLNNSEMTFPPALLIPMLEKYAAEHQNGIGPIHWLPDLFIAVNVPFENICSTMQAMLFQNLAPFTGKGKRPLAEHLLYICEQWLEECVRKNVVPYGGEQNAVEIDELVNLMLTQGDLGASERERAAELRRKIVRCFS